MNIKRGLTSLLVGCIMVPVLSVAVMAASEDLNQGGGTWSGGEFEKILFFESSR